MLKGLRRGGVSPNKCRKKVIRQNMTYLHLIEEMYRHFESKSLVHTLVTALKPYKRILY